MADIHDLPQFDESLAAWPQAPTAEMGRVWDEARRRRRMLEGLWRDDLEQLIREHLGPGRRRRQGPSDMSKNLFRSLVVSLGVLFDRPPTLIHDDFAAVEVMTAALTAAGAWPLSMRLQHLVMGQREAARVFAVLPDGTVQVRNVPLDLLYAVASPATPDDPHTIYEYRIRTDPRGREMWTRDHWSIEDPAHPVFRVEDVDGKDLSGIFTVPKEYPWRGQSGAPILPAVLYHAVHTGRLFDPFAGIEVVEGSLFIAMLWTMWGHVVKDCSWPQRYTVNLGVGGAQSADPGNSEITVDADPALVLPFVVERPGMPHAIGQWSAGGDPEVLGRAITEYANDLARDFDLGGGELARNHDARSGYAIVISRETARDAQRRAAPNFQRGDRLFLSRLAGMLGLPEDGWDLEYAGVPLSLEERNVMIAEFRAHSELGLTSQVELYAKLHGVTNDQARLALRVIRQDVAEFRPTT